MTDYTQLEIKHKDHPRTLEVITQRDGFLLTIYERSGACKFSYLTFDEADQLVTMLGGLPGQRIVEGCRVSWADGGLGSGGRAGKPLFGYVPVKWDSSDEPTLHKLDELKRID